MAGTAFAWASSPRSDTDLAACIAAAGMCAFPDCAASCDAEEVSEGWLVGLLGVRAELGLTCALVEAGPIGFLRGETGLPAEVTDSCRTSTD